MHLFVAKDDADITEEGQAAVVMNAATVVPRGLAADAEDGLGAVKPIDGHGVVVAVLEGSGVNDVAAGVDIVVVVVALVAKFRFLGGGDDADGDVQVRVGRHDEVEEAAAKFTDGDVVTEAGSTARGIHVVAGAGGDLYGELDFFFITITIILSNKVSAVGCEFEVDSIADIVPTVLLGDECHRFFIGGGNGDGCALAIGDGNLIIDIGGAHSVERERAAVVRALRIVDVAEGLIALSPGGACRRYRRSQQYYECFDSLCHIFFHVFILQHIIPIVYILAHYHLLSVDNHKALVALADALAAEVVPLIILHFHVTM